MSIETFIRENLIRVCERQGIQYSEFLIEITKQAEFGDLSSNIALVSAKSAGNNPRELATSIARDFPTDSNYVQSVEVAGPGFLNFFIGRKFLEGQLKSIEASPSEFGDSKEGDGKQWLFEFVSANPTGPMNIVSARAAAVGDSLVRILRKRGYIVLAEYYVNDGGGQVRNLGGSLRARLSELSKEQSEVQIPDEGYHGEYVVDLAKLWLKECSDKEIPPDDLNLGMWAASRIRDGQETALERYRVSFDRWFRESELYDADKVKGAFDDLNSRGVTYEKDGAIWFRASEFGDSQDRVLKTSKGRFTYIVPDIAYHLDKRDRGNVRAVTVLGPDHHGHIAQLDSALRAVGVPDGFFQPLLIQQVNLRRGGEEIKMSKRAGVGITMEDLIQEVGVDAARFFFLMRRTSSHLDFDIDLAKRHSEENPVYYVQYAHARIRSIFRQPDAFSPDTETDLEALVAPEEIWLMRMLARFPWTLATVARSLEPHPITVYLTDLAKSFHSFYQRHRVISDDKALTAARLRLCKAVASVIKNGLSLIGVSAPERM